jgi:hypothetical protein
MNMKMNYIAENNSRLSISDCIVIFIILAQGTNHLVVFSSPFFKYVILLLGVALTYQYIHEEKEIEININIVIGLLLMYAYSLIVSFSVRLFVPMLYFAIEILIFKMYIGTFESRDALFERLLKIIYISSNIIVVIGFIQIIAYHLNIKFLYDYSWMGIIPNYYGYLDEGRFYSIYDEPAHLCTILGSGLFSSFYYYKQQGLKYLIPFVATGIFALFTGSIITYLAVFIFLLLIIIYDVRCRKMTKKEYKILFLVLIVVALGLIAFINSGFFSNSIDKLYNFFSSDASNAYAQSNTTFALKSNFLISILKLKKYPLGTGIFTHELYYYSYIDIAYPVRYQKYLNYSDAASIFIRYISEFGFLSIVIFAFILFVVIKSFKDKNIQVMFYITLFITQGMRLGDYTWLFNCLPLVIIISSMSSRKIYIKIKRIKALKNIKQLISISK